MAQPSTTTLQNLSIPNRQAGWFHPNDLFVDQFLFKLPRIEMEMATDSYQFNTADTIPSISFLARSETKTLPATNVSLVTSSFERVGNHIELDTYDSISGRMSNNLEVQARGVKLGLLRELSDKLIEGTASPDIIGLRSKTGSSTVGANNGNANGGFMSLQDIYKALYTCQPTNDMVGGGAADCAVLNPKALRELLGLINATDHSQGGRWVEDPELGAPVFEYLGIKWYISDSVPLNETKGSGTNLTSIYFVKLNGPTGLKLLYARDPECYDVDEFGIHTYSIPINQTQNRRGLCIEGFYTLVRPERMSVSRLDGINPTQYAL